MSELENPFQRVSPAVTEDDLNEVESSFGFAFPPEFRAHYLKYNGGRPERNVFYGVDVECEVQNFLPIKYAKTGFRFEDTYRNLSLPFTMEGEVVDAPVLPSHLLAFARDPGGDYFCFSTRKEDCGAIYHFMGEYAITDPPRAVMLLAGSLHEFLTKLEAD